MLAAVCESDSWFAMCTNIDYAVGGLCGDSSISFDSHGWPGQVVVVCQVGFALLLLDILLSGSICVVSTSAWVQLQILLLLLCFSGNWVGSSHPSKLLRGGFLIIVGNYHWSDGPQYQQPHVVSLIHKLMVSTIRTGTVTSVVAVVTLILFLIDNKRNSEPIPQYYSSMTDLSLWLQHQLPVHLHFALAGSTLLPCSITWTIDIHSSKNQSIQMMSTA